MDALGVKRPDISPRATGHIIEQIEMIEPLIEKAFAYEVNGSVYFEVSKDREYGKLSGRSTEEVESGMRIDVKLEKRHPNDFALWKRAEPEHIMRWGSPWGVGFPGWHIECSAMSMKYLGVPFDIHGGGMDNQFPHHECEIAQSEMALGTQFVRYWIHNNLITVNGQKMSKSLGNVILLKELFKKFHPLVVRFFILQSHYRSTLDFTEEALEGAARGWEKMMNTVRIVHKGARFEVGELNSSISQATQLKPLSIENYKADFVDAMNDDFNTAQAIAVLFDLNREINARLSESSLVSDELRALDLLYSELAGNILGILPVHLEESDQTGRSLEGELMQLLIELRAETRAQKQWALADRIRDGLTKAGILREDRKEQTIWKRGTPA